MVNTASTEFDLSDNEKGLYLIKVSSESGVKTIRSCETVRDYLIVKKQKRFCFFLQKHIENCEAIRGIKYLVCKSLLILSKGFYI